jgi:transcriptional regulator with XRE-family HTH domain
MTKDELAARADVSNSFLTAITKGNANPSLKKMEAIAMALDTPLPVLLEITDLDQSALEELWGDALVKSLPSGFVRVNAILTEYEAYQVQQLHQKNIKLLRKKWQEKHSTYLKRKKKK